MKTGVPLLVYMTIGSAQEAASLAETLVTERLLACANIMPGVRSVFHWQGQVQQAEEAVIIGKTTQAQYAALEQRFCALHPYEVPCIVALPITQGHVPFLQWVAAQATPEQP